MMDSQSLIKNELDEALSTLNHFIVTNQGIQSIEAVANKMISAIHKGNKIIACGNGGSHCDAMHFAEELTGKYRYNRRPLPAICITNPAHLSCVGNDYGYRFIFSRYIEAIGKPGDVLFAISVSGQSANMIAAAQAAQKKKMIVVGLSGQDGGQLSNHADLMIKVPHQGYADRVQEMHIKIIHILILLIEKQAC